MLKGLSGRTEGISDTTGHRMFQNDGASKLHSFREDPGWKDGFHSLCTWRYQAVQLSRRDGAGTGSDSASGSCSCGELTS